MITAVDNVRTRPGLLVEDENIITQVYHGKISSADDQTQSVFNDRSVTTKCK